MPDIDYSTLIQIGNFILLLLCLNIIVYRPVRGILNKRREEIELSEKFTNEWNKKTDVFSGEIEIYISETEEEGLKEKSHIKYQGLEMQKELLQDAASQVEERIESAKKDIREKITRARAILISESEIYSHELVEKILERGI